MLYYRILIMVVFFLWLQLFYNCDICHLLLLLKTFLIDANDACVIRFHRFFYGTVLPETCIPIHILNRLGGQCYLFASSYGSPD